VIRAALVRHVRELQRSGVQHQAGAGVPKLPKTYEEFLSKKQWANRVAIDGTDNEWLKAIFEYYGEQRATELVKGIVSTLKPIITDGHLALARATGAGEYAISLNNYVNLSMNVKLGGGPIDVWAMDPVALMFGQVGVSALAPNPNAARLAANFMISQEAQQFIAKFGRLPTRRRRRPTIRPAPSRCSSRRRSFRCC
jgi:iron(III) transport system substrate-binding protein